MTKDEEVMQKVQRGVALLDRRNPGWRERVDVDHLRLANGQKCVLGQLYGDYGDGVRKLGIRRPENYGFLAEDGVDWWVSTAPAYRRLGRLWRRVLRGQA